MVQLTSSARPHIELLQRIAFERLQRRKRQVTLLAISLSCGIAASSLLSWQYLSLQLSIGLALLGSILAFISGWRFYRSSRETLPQLALLIDQTWNTAGEYTALWDLSEKEESQINQEKIDIIASQLSDHLSKHPPTTISEKTFSKKQKILLALGPLALVFTIGLISIQQQPKVGASSIAEILSNELEQFLKENPTLPKSIEKQLSELANTLQDESLSTTELQEALEQASKKIKETKEIFSSLSEPPQKQPNPDDLPKEYQTPPPPPKATPTPETSQDKSDDSQGEKNEKVEKSEGDGSEKQDQGSDDSEENSENGEEDEGNSEGQGESGSEQGKEGSSAGESGQGDGENSQPQSQESSSQSSNDQNDSSEDANGNKSEGEEGKSGSESAEQGSPSKEGASDSSSSSLNKAEALLQEMKERLAEEEQQGDGKDGKEQEAPPNSPSGNEGEKQDQASKEPSQGDASEGDRASDQERDSSQEEPRQAAGRSDSDSQQIQPEQNAEGQVSTQGDGPPVDREGGDSKFQEGGFGFEDKELGSSAEEFDTRYMENTGRSLQNDDEVESQLKAIEQPLAPPQPKDSRKRQRIPLEYQNIITD